MPSIADAVFDAALNVITTNLSQVDICTQEPTTFTEATSTFSIGTKTSASAGSPLNGDVDGRKVVIAAITDGAVDGTDTATHFAGTNGTDAMYVAGSLSSSQAVTSGNPFTLDAINVGLRDPS